MKKHLSCDIMLRASLTKINFLPFQIIPECYEQIWLPKCRTMAIASWFISFRFQGFPVKLDG